jgi:hypothetical protein
MLFFWVVMSCGFVEKRRPTVSIFRVEDLWNMFGQFKQLMTVIFILAAVRTWNLINLWLFLWWRSLTNGHFITDPLVRRAKNNYQFWPGIQVAYRAHVALPPSPLYAPPRRMFSVCLSRRRKIVISEVPCLEFPVILHYGVMNWWH